MLKADNWPAFQAKVDEVSIRVDMEPLEAALLTEPILQTKKAR